MVKFFRDQPVLCIAALLAAVSCVLVPPNPGYADYFDLRVLALLFCMMLSVVGLKEAGLFDWVLDRLPKGGGARLAFPLVACVFFSSMLVTNDVALIAFVPFTLFALQARGSAKQAAVIVVLETLAANMGSMATPFGNPQNLYLFTHFGMDLGAFELTVLPYTVLSGVVVLGAAWAYGRAQGANEPQRTHQAVSQRKVEEPAASSSAQETPLRGLPSRGLPSKGLPGAQGKNLRAAQAAASLSRSGSRASDASEANGADLAPFPNAGPKPIGSLVVTGPNMRERERLRRIVLLGFGALFVISALSVVGVVPYFAALAACLGLAFCLYPQSFLKVDYALLLTFVCFFLFTGNLAAVNGVRQGITALMSQAPFAVSVLTSQVISNVPAAALLAPFTDAWGQLLAGVDIGGLGTPVASLASLISLEFYRKSHVGPLSCYMAVFLASNVILLFANCLLWGLIGSGGGMVV